MRLIAFILMASAVLAKAATNILILTWNEPVGYHSTLYESTNLTSGWTQFSTSSPPVSVESAKDSAFFYVTVEPSSNPSILTYTNDDPNTSGVKPLDTNGVGIIYDPNGIHGTFFWNAQDQSWH